MDLTNVYIVILFALEQKDC